MVLLTLLASVERRHYKLKVYVLVVTASLSSKIYDRYSMILIPKP